jgi:two-component system response regulator YesN
MRVMVVDDEMIVRVGIKSMVPWAELGCELVAEASNGREAYELIPSTRPDLILADIRMPEMDGLELLERVHRECPQIRVVILSCHNDFEYVRRALQMGAVDYVPKLSLQPRELQKLLERIRSEKLSKEQADAEHQLAPSVKQKLNLGGQAMRQKLLFDTIKGHLVSPRQWKEALREWSLRMDGPVGLLIFRISGFERMLQLQQVVNPELLLYSAANICEELLNEHMRGEVQYRASGELIVFCCPQPEADWRSASEALAVHIQQALEQYLKLVVSCGVTSGLFTPPELAPAYTEGLEALSFAFFGGSRSIVHGADILRAADEEPVLLSADDERRLEEAVAARQLTQLQEQLDELAGRLGTGRQSVQQARRLWTDWLNMFQRALQRSGCSLQELPEHEGWNPHEAVLQLETLGELRTWLRAWVQVVLSEVNRKVSPAWRQEIVSVQQWVKRHIQSKITVADIARHVGYTESYISHLYKKETGMSLVDYMTKVRMDKAKELLHSIQEYRIYEIADACGFADANYFSRQFKRIEGLSPHEFRQRWLEEADR